MLYCSSCPNPHESSPVRTCENAEFHTHFCFSHFFIHTLVLFVPGCHSLLTAELTAEERIISYTQLVHQNQNHTAHIHLALLDSSMQWIPGHGKVFSSNLQHTPGGWVSLSVISMFTSAQMKQIKVENKFTLF